MRVPGWRWDNVPLPEQHLVALGAATLADVILPLRVPIHRGSARLAGGAVLAAGISLAAWAVTSASRAGVGVDHPTDLVTAGAFGVARNPMYQGWTLAIIGLGIAARSPWMLTAAVIATAAAHRAILDEEMATSRQFGEEYEAYRGRTPRYVGSAEAVARVRRMIRGRSVIDGGDR
jgi:protein-S-isoprenylcysteine O-methyltransferase Ste14